MAHSFDSKSRLHLTCGRDCCMRARCRVERDLADPQRFACRQRFPLNRDFLWLINSQNNLQILPTAQVSEIAEIGALW